MASIRRANDSMMRRYNSSRRHGVFDARIQVRIVVDFDDQELFVNFFDVDAVKSVANQVGRFDRRADGLARRQFDRKRFTFSESWFSVRCRRVFRDLPVAACHVVLAREHRSSVQHADSPVKIGPHVLLGDDQFRIVKEFRQSRL